MKKKASTTGRVADQDTMRPEYDFSKAVRGVTAARHPGPETTCIAPESFQEAHGSTRAHRDARG